MTNKEKALKLVKVCELTLNKKDENIGKRVHFKEIPGLGLLQKQNDLIIIGTQKVYGYDKNGNYTLIDGYRGVLVNEEDDFGYAFSLNDVYFVD